MAKIFRRLLGSIYARLRSAYYLRQYEYFKKHYNIESSFKFNGIDIRIYGEGKLVLGNDSYIGSYSTIELSPETKVVIGEKCQISHNVRMYTTTAISDQDFLARRRKSKKGDIIIGKGVWIGANVFINPGVEIGDNSIIGANSVVTRDIPAGAIFGGVPARLIRFKNFERVAERYKDNYSLR